MAAVSPSRKSVMDQELVSKVPYHSLFLTVFPSYIAKSIDNATHESRSFLAMTPSALSHKEQQPFHFSSAYRASTHSNQETNMT